MSGNTPSAAAAERAQRRTRTPRRGRFALVLDLFPGRERWLLAGVLALSGVAAFFEAIAVAAILPFMAVLLEPERLNSYPTLLNWMRGLGVTGERDAILLVGGITVAVVAIANLISAVNVYIQLRFAARSETRLATTLFEGYMRQPWAFHVRRDAPSLLKVLITDVNAVMAGVITPAILGTSKLVVAVGILLLLIVHDPVVAFLVAAVLVLSYAAVYQLVRGSQTRSGDVANFANLRRNRIAQESFGGVKELQVLGRQQASLDGLRSAVWEGATARAFNVAVGVVPRYVLETVAFGGILLTALALVAGSTSAAENVIPVLALYAFAGYRLMPALQQVFAAVISVRFYSAALATLHDDLQSVGGALHSPAPTRQDVRLRHTLSLDEVTFSYEGASAPSLRDVSLQIHAGESVGLVGRTGAGKTTLADIILGLHLPTAGIVTVDDVELTRDTVQAWQRSVGYVPQSVFLSNASVAQNIAFGLEARTVDRDAVAAAALLAQAEEFILQLPQGYDTVVGERGIKLSGGQRQRIGIARALYHDPDVLVFDEATSALDGLTESAVMEAIRELRGRRTIILIAHRMRTVEACDRIVVLEAGRVVADGRYDDLLLASDTFRGLVGLVDQQA